MKKNINRRKLFMIIGICILGISLIGGTVAFFVKEIFRVNDQNTITYGLDYYINYAKGQDIVATTLNPSSSYEGSPSSDIEFWKKDNTYDIYGHIYLDVNSLSDNLSDSGALKYVVTYNNNVISDGVVTNDSESILLIPNIPLKTSSQLYTVHIWLDETIATGDLSNSNLSLSVRSEATMKIMPVQEATDYIKNLYIYGNPTQITQGGSGDSYYYASEYGLMNDGFDNEGNRTNSMRKGNIRYYGANPDNYIYFNCSDYDNQSDDTCERWRIIGVFDGKLKIMRDESIGSYAWDNNPSGDTANKASGTHDNNWSDSTLRVLLNNEYYNNIGLVTKFLISETTWNLGGSDGGTARIYPSARYIAERGTGKHSTYTFDTSWTGNVGLMYASDYGFAGDLTQCSAQFLDYYTSANVGCRTANWMFSSSNDKWTISPYALKYAWSSRTNGQMALDNTVNMLKGVHPVVYLNSDVALNGGNGTSDDPYRLGTKVNNNVTPNGDNLKDYITNLYLTNKDKKVTNNSIEYQYATSVNLMNDRLGGTTSNYDGGNIRYYGANPNNYIYFNCDDYSNQSDSTCEKWRIIGIVDGKVKIIRDESLGDYVWDYTSTGEYDNNWYDSTLQVLLNNGYYNNSNGIKYYNNSTTPKTINFKTDKKGIKNDKTREMISKSTWYLGGHNSSSIYANNIYKYERGTNASSNTSSTWTGKIGLMYPSDYGYAADLSVCNQILWNYETTTNCKGTDWLFNNSYQWLITPYSSSSNVAWIVDSSGLVNYYYGVYYADGVRAVLYLDSELVIGSEGDGSTETPYQIAVS